MTEMNKHTEPRDIHWTGFWTSLIAAPLVVGGALCAPFYVHGALFDSPNSHEIANVLGVLSVIGATFYFAIGTPALIWHLRRHAPDVRQMIVWALVSLLWMLPLGLLLAIGVRDVFGLLMAVISMCFGVFGAPPLAAVFTLLYKRFPQR